jgi:hypothetical protein
MNSYTLERREDKNIWVNIQPLMADIQKHFDNLHEMDTSEFTEQDKQLLDLKVIGLRAIYEFIGALKLEHELKELREKQAKEEVDRQLNDIINKGAKLMEKAFK